MKFSRTFATLGNSVTGFDEISPFWQKLKRFEHFSESLSDIWQNFDPTKAKF